MVFQIIKTSGCCYPPDHKPHEQCVLAKLPMVQKLNFDSPEQYNELIAKHQKKPKWFDEGINHRQGRDLRNCHYIARDMGETDVWVIEINSIEDLIKFQQSVNEELILRVSPIDYETPCLEIYNDYRE